MKPELLKLIGLIIIQCIMMTASQMMLKVSLQKFGKFEWSSRYFKVVFSTWEFAASGLLMIGFVILWSYLLKRYEFSLVYPLTGISFLIGLIASVIFFHEVVSITRWIGVIVMLIGIFLICR